MVKQDYVCPRCGYTTNHKVNMRTHFMRKNVCPGIVNADLELSDEIKDHVLLNRIYKVKKLPNVKQIIINNTQINNYFNKMDLSGKVSLLNSQPMQCSDKVLNLVRRESTIHQNDTPGLVIDKTYLQDLVGKMCRSNGKDLSDMNVLIDVKSNSMAMFEEDEWREYDIPSGARHLMICIHSNFMNEHERYLLRCIDKSKNLRARQDLKDQILKYYKIVASYDLEPYCLHKCDDDIIDNGSTEHRLEDEFYPKFIKIKNTLSNSERNSLCKMIIMTIKSNGKNSTLMLNTKLCELSQKNGLLIKAD